ncbi:MAG: hypothetical protein GY801_45955 [bacterium]|nr:hypothetical protein [bacterium]
MTSIVRDLPFVLNMENVLRRQGLGTKSQVKHKTFALLQELLTEVEELRLLESAVAYRFQEITTIHAERVQVEKGITISGKLLPTTFPEATHLAVAVCTVGPKLEEQVTVYFNKGEKLRGLLLDSIGSTVTDLLCVEASHLIRREATSQSRQASSPVQAGMPGFAITEQKTIFQLLDTTEIGVKLTSSSVMFPRKSVSFVVGIGANMPQWTPAEACQRCSLYDICHYKIRDDGRNEHAKVG